MTYHHMDNSPFSQFPSELVEKIFLFCLPVFPSTRTHHAPLLLTHVCRTWRSIAEDTPLLWSHIAVPRWTECPRNIVDLADLWLSRSKHHSLSVDISLFNEEAQILSDSKDAEGLDNVAKNIVALLAPHLPRIQNLWGIFPTSCIPLLCVSEMVNVERIFYYGTPQFVNLLRIPEDFGSHAQGIATELGLGSAKENLKILSVSDCAVDISSVMLQTQLTHLELFDLSHTRMSQETAFEILGSLPNLTKCVLELYKEERPDWNGPSSRLILHNLELLFLIWIFPADVGILLGSISTPNLVRLGCRGTPTVGPRAWTGLRDFLQVSQPPLMRLTLGNFEDVDVQLIDCLRCCPLLTHLSISHSRLPDELPPALTCKGEAWDAELLPRLEILNLVSCVNLKGRTVASFLMSRAREVPPGYSHLREVEIINCLNITQKDVPTLQRCGVEKFTLKILYD